MYLIAAMAAAAAACVSAYVRLENKFPDVTLQVVKGIHRRVGAFLVVGNFVKNMIDVLRGTAINAPFVGSQPLRPSSQFGQPAGVADAS